MINQAGYWQQKYFEECTKVRCLEEQLAGARDDAEYKQLYLEKMMQYSELVDELNERAKNHQEELQILMKSLVAMERQCIALEQALQERQKEVWLAEDARKKALGATFYPQYEEAKESLKYYADKYHDLAVKYNKILGAFSDLKTAIESD